MTVVVGGVDVDVAWIMFHLKINKTNKQSFHDPYFILSESYIYGCFNKLKAVPQKSKRLCDNAVSWY